MKAPSFRRLMSRHPQLRPGGLNTVPLRFCQALGAVVLPAVLGAQDYSVVFEGRPVEKVEVAFGGTLPVRLSADEGFRYAVRIVERGGRYFWASREMRELVRRETAGYVTFVAPDGSGYVRILSPMLEALRAQLPEAERRREATYTEHLTIQLGSITYFGNRSAPASR